MKLRRFLRSVLNLLLDSTLPAMERTAHVPMVAVTLPSALRNTKNAQRYHTMKSGCIILTREPVGSAACVITEAVLIITRIDFARIAIAVGEDA